MLYNINDYFDKLQIAGIDIPIGMRIEALRGIDAMGSFIFDNDSVKVWENLRDDIFSALAIREKDELIANMIFVKHFRVGDYSSFVRTNLRKIVRTMVKNHKKTEVVGESKEKESENDNNQQRKTESVFQISETDQEEDTLEDDDGDNEGENQGEENDTQVEEQSIFDDINDIIDEYEEEETEIDYEEDTEIEIEEEFPEEDDEEYKKLDDFVKEIPEFDKAVRELEDAGYEIDISKSADSIANDVWQIRNAIQSDLRGEKNKKLRERLLECLNIVRQHKVEEEEIEKEIIGETVKNIELIEAGDKNPENVQYINISQIPETKLLLEVERIANEIVTDRSRDMFVSESGNEIDLFDTITESMSNMRGAISNIYYYHHDKGQAKILVVCDLSGSMSPYINMTLNLVMNMRKIIEDIQITAFSEQDAILTESIFADENMKINGNWKNLFASIFNIVPIRGTSLVYHLNNLIKWSETDRIKLDDETITIIISDMLATDVPANWGESQYHPEIGNRLLKIKHKCKELIIFSPSGGHDRYNCHHKNNANINNLEQYRTKVGIRYATIDTLNDLRRAVLSIV